MTRHPAGASRRTRASTGSRPVLVTVTRTSRGALEPVGMIANLGCHRDRELRHDVQFRPLLAGEDVVDVAVLDRPFDRQSGGPELDLERRAEGRRPERRPERHVGIERVAVRALDVGPVHAGHRRAGGHRPRERALEDAAGHHPSPVAGGPAPVEARQRHAAHGYRRSPAIRRQELHRHALPGRHHPIVRQCFQAHAVGQQGGPLELALLRLQAASRSRGGTSPRAASRRGRRAGRARRRARPRPPLAPPTCPPRRSGGAPRGRGRRAPRAPG